MPDDYDAVVRLWSEAGLDARTTGRDRREAFILQLERFPTLFLIAECDDSSVVPQI